MPAPVASPSEAIRALSRLLDAALDSAGPSVARQTLVLEARGLFAASTVILLGVEAHDGTVTALACDPHSGLAGRTAPVEVIPALRRLMEVRGSAVAADVTETHAIVRVLGLQVLAGNALLLPMRSREALDHVLLVIGEPARDFTPEEVEAGVSFAAAAAAALAQMRLAEEQAARGARQSALARAAKALHATLDLPDVLAAICREAEAILDGDVAAVYRGNARDGLTIEAVNDFPQDVLGYRLAPGQGLSGRVAQAGHPMLTNEYHRVATLRPDSPFKDVRSCLGVPMTWDGELRGVLSVGFTRPRPVGAADLSLLEAFAELAAAACRNASAAAGLAMAARTDGLTGCLNHTALHDGVRREAERCARTGQRLSLVLLDLDHFKQVNERCGHLVGDEVLRRAGHALSSSTRPYDLVARYGGDEFAILAVDADEAEALEIGERAIERVSVALGDLQGDDPPSYATAGVAQWREGWTPTDLIEAADRALLHGKQTGLRGRSLPVSDTPAEFMTAKAGAATSAHEPARWPVADLAANADRLHKRTRQLTMANALGARLSAMTDPADIFEATVDELHRAFDFFLCAVIRIRPDGFVEATSVRGERFQRLVEGAWSQPRDTGIIGRCLRERSVVLVNDVTREATYRVTSETAEVLSELVAPVWVGDELWGAINLEEVARDAFDEDDVRLVQTVAVQVGSALRSAQLYEQLERAYLGTAEALAAALEAKDSYTARHAHSIVPWALACGESLGMSDRELRDLRYGAVFHDIGKIAVPEAILNKPGPLDDDELLTMQRHTVVGEQILAPVDFLSGVLPLVRHEHERWDGDGYPDGLAGAAIPLGARIILVCDAYHAMTSDRPYRSAMDHDEACAELVANAGTQFDAAVVEVFLVAVAPCSDRFSVATPG